ERPHRPAAERLRRPAAERPDRPPVRRHHRRRHGAAVLHPADRALEGRRGRRGAAGQQDGHGPGAGRARQADGPGLHVLRRLRPGEPPRGHQQGRGGRARLPPAHAEGGQRRHQAVPAPPPRGGRCVHRHRRPHGGDRRDPQHQGVRGGEGAGVLPGDQGGQPRRPGLGARARRGRPDRARRRRPGLPGRHPARRPPAQHPGDVRGVPRGLPGGEPPPPRRRRPAVQRGHGGRARGRPRVQPGHHSGRGGLLPRPPGHPRPRRRSAKHLQHPRGTEGEGIV
ncbi:MAG: L-beta-lysine 5,6-aminomutase beta subunit @ D-lysine 5,6-aminomutase beta subunit, partial [uncultured Nocardioides sp.]